MKKAKSGVKYFDGTVTDSSRNLRIVGFDEKLQIKLSTLTENKSPVKVESCQIKQSRNDDFEILLKRSSNILPSPKKIEIPVSSLTTLKVQNASITELNTIEDGEIVNLIATVTCVAPACPVSTGLVQEVTIADETGSTILSAWDTNINKLRMSMKYDFQRLFVHSYKNEKMLALSTQSTYEISTNAGIKLQSVMVITSRK